MHPLLGRSDVEVALRGGARRSARYHELERRHREPLHHRDQSPHRRRRSGTIQLGLTNREGLTHRMLLGRQAIQPGMLVDPANSFLQPRLSLRAYKK